MRPHRQQLTRLPRPWDSPGKNTGVGCHFLLQCMKVKVKSLSHVRLLVTPWTAAYQGPPSMGFSRQEYWSGVPLPSPIPGTYYAINTRMFNYHYNCLQICAYSTHHQNVFILSPKSLLNLNPHLDFTFTLLI